MEEEALVSVVMPAYRCAGTIGRAIESVLAQEVPVELIVLNDCSPDHLDAVMEPYLDLPELRYVRNEQNLGAAASRNRGVRLARGAYIAFLDADDWWEKDKLKKQLALMKEQKAVLCAAARELMRPDGTSTGRVIGVREHITYRSLLGHNCINCSSVVLRADVAREFPMEHEDSHEDYITWLRILKKYGSACAVNEPLLKYRLTGRGKSGGKLKSARMTWQVYRYCGFPVWQSCILFAAYAANGVCKYAAAYLRGMTGKRVR